MVKRKRLDLGRTFAALANPTRRELIARLGAHPRLSVSDLARPFAMSLPAIMKHLGVLADAGLIVRNKTGRIVSCHLTAAPMEDAMRWLNRYHRFWSHQLDRLAAFVEEENACPPSSAPPPSSSRAGSRRLRRKSTPPGRTRRK